MLDDDILKQLHHVLLEVSRPRSTYLPFSSTIMPSLDPCRRGLHDMSELWTRLSYLERDPKHGPHLASLPIHYSFSSSVHLPA